MSTATGPVIRSLSIWFVLAFVALVVFPNRADAHAELRSSEPAAEALLAAHPSIVNLTFSEPVGALVLTWLLPNGTKAEAQALAASANGLDITPPPETGQGTYVLTWRVASIDGHPVGGSLVFSVGNATGAAPSLTAAPGAVPAIAARFLAVLAMIIAIGTGIYAAFIAPLTPLAKRLGRYAAVAALPMAVTGVGAYGLDLLGLQLSGLFSIVTWTVGISAPRGWSLFLGAAGALVSLEAMGGNRRPALVALALGATSLAVSGHAAAGDQPAIGQALMAVHAAALIFWLGGLLPLWTGVAAHGGLVALRRFSAIALPAVILLASTGLGLIVLRGVGVEALAASAWGQLLALKLALVAGMLVLAAVNRQVLTPALESGSIYAPERLRRSIMAELALGAGVLICAMCFRITPPPEAVSPASTVYAHLHGDEAMVEVAVTPAPPGAVEFAFVVYDNAMKPLAPKEMRLSLTDPTAGIGPIRIEADQNSPDGQWTAGPVTLPTGGPWDMRLAILIDDFKQVTLDATIPAR